MQSTILNFTCTDYFIVRLLIFGQGIVYKRTIFISLYVSYAHTTLTDPFNHHFNHHGNNSSPKYSLSTVFFILYFSLSPHIHLIMFVSFLSNFTSCFTLLHHHHRERAPGWSVAVSTSCLHRSPSWASRHAELSPWLSRWRSAFRVRSQLWRGRPGRHLQSLGSPRVDICRALKVSWENGCV